jgi:hypothetical protein
VLDRLSSKCICDPGMSTMFVLFDKIGVHGTTVSQNMIDQFRIDLRVT